MVIFVEIIGSLFLITLIITLSIGIVKAIIEISLEVRENKAKLKHLKQKQKLIMREQKKELDMIEVIRKTKRMDDNGKF